MGCCGVTLDRAARRDIYHSYDTDTELSFEIPSHRYSAVGYSVMLSEIKLILVEG